MAGNRRNHPAQWVLPDIVRPKTSVCFQVQVPNEIHHIGAFLGAIFNLTSARFWADDEAHTAKEVALVWREIFDKLKRGCAPAVIKLPAESEYEMALCEQLRVNNGKIQAMCCGEWQDIPGQEGISIGGPSQPGDGTPQPEPGGCTSYHMILDAKMQWILPAPVSEGDVISFSNSKGTATDGSGSTILYCPNGSVYFAGSCTGVYNNNDSDPLPTAAHMGLIAQIDGVWYDTQDPITVPSGVTNGTVVFQVNDSDTSNNSGGYTVDVELCNNQPGDWSATWDFRLTPGPFQIIDLVSPFEDSRWIPTVGWSGTPKSSGTGSTNAIYTTYPSTRIVYGRLRGTHGDASSAGATREFKINDNNEPLPAAAGPFDVIQTADVTGTIIRLQYDNDISSEPSIFTDLEVHGIGPKPEGWPAT